MIKPVKIFFYRSNSSMILKLGMERYVPKFYKVNMNYDPELNLTYLMTMSNLAKSVFFFYYYKAQTAGDHLQAPHTHLECRL